MKQLKNTISLLALLLLAQYSWAQSTSPYSRYGLGNVSQKGSVRTRTMGGTGVGMQHYTDVNNINPSALVAMDSTAVLFDLGFHASASRLDDGSNSKLSYSGNLDYVTLMIPFKSFWFTSVSLQPLSNVGYDVTTTKPYSGGTNNESYYVNYDGSGGGSLASMTNSFKLPWGFSIGVEAGLLWGNHDETVTESYSGMDMSYSIRRDISYYQGLWAVGGLQYAHNFKATKLVLGATYNVPTSMRTESEYTINSALGTVDESYTGTTYSKLPMGYAFGFSLEHDKRYTIAADYKFSEWGESELGVDPGKYVDNHTFNVGFEMVPNYNSNYYRQRIAYRAGARHETGYFKISGDNVETTAFTVGLGLPGRMRNTMVNVGFEIGTIGALNSKHMNETYGKLNLGFNLGEIWFVKQKFY